MKTRPRQNFVFWQKLLYFVLCSSQTFHFNIIEFYYRVDKQYNGGALYSLFTHKPWGCKLLHSPACGACASKLYEVNCWLAILHNLYCSHLCYTAMVSFFSGLTVNGFTHSSSDVVVRVKHAIYTFLNVTHIMCCVMCVLWITW